MEVVSLAVIKLSLVAVFGFMLYRKKLVTEDILKFLTTFVVNYTVPFLIFAHFMSNYKVVLAGDILKFLLLSIIIFVFGYILGFIFISKRKCKLKPECISLISFQNGGYLPMNIAFFLFSSKIRVEFITYIFLYLLGYNILMWSLGSFFVFKKKKEKFPLKTIVTPPIVSIILALLLIYTNTAKFVPNLIIAPLKMVGDTSFMLSALVLGCWLAKADIERVLNKIFLLGQVSFIKLIVFPAVCLIILLKLEISSLFGVFVILQSSMPSAASLPIIAQLRRGDSKFVSQGVFLTHIFSIFTIPLWLGLYSYMSGFSLVNL